MKNPFKIEGYLIDYYLSGKYIGSIKIKKADRKVLGYLGRKQIILKEDKIFKNKKYKSGTKLITECIPICGKYNGTYEEKITAMFNSRLIYN